jgi:hypothetical protein
MRELAEQGLGLLDNEAPERRYRLEQLQEFTAFFEREIPALLTRWRNEHQQET